MKGGRPLAEVELVGTGLLHGKDNLAQRTEAKGGTGRTANDKINDCHHLTSASASAAANQTVDLLGLARSLLLLLVGVIPRGVPGGGRGRGGRRRPASLRI